MDHKSLGVVDLKSLREEVESSEELGEEGRRWIEERRGRKGEMEGMDEGERRGFLELMFAVVEKYPQGYRDYVVQSQEACGDLSEKQVQEHQEFLLSKLNLYSQPQTQLMILSFLVGLNTAKPQKVIWERQLALQLRITGSVLHNYLRLRKEKASSSQDRLHHDILIEKHCEEWVQESLTSSITAYKVQLLKSPRLKRYFANFACDLAAALLQGFVESDLRKDVLVSLLTESERAILENYSVAEFAGIFSSTLHNNQMKSPLKSLEIVEIYAEGELLNPAGYSYLQSRILAQPHTLLVSSQETVLRGLLSSLGESIKREHPVKHDILTLAEKILLETKVRARSDDEFGYPISLLITNLVESRQEESLYTNQKINKILTVLGDWNWSLSRCVDFSTKTSSKTFVLQQMAATNNLNNYYVLSTLHPLASQKDFSDLYIDTLIKVKPLVYPWVQSLLEEKSKTKSISERLK